MYVDTPFSLAQNGQRIQKKRDRYSLSASPALQSSDFGEGKFFCITSSHHLLLAQDDFF